jgi:hypothetical protein
VSDTELNEMLAEHAKEKAALLLRVAELENSLRNEREESSQGSAQLNAMLANVNQQLDAAKADAARSREGLEDMTGFADGLREVLRHVEKHFDTPNKETLLMVRGAIAATHFGEWLESKIAERTTLHVEREKSLTAQLVAATNDAARAELRARDALDALTLAKRALTNEWHNKPRIGMESEYAVVSSAIAANPDSDERLREVMLRVAELTVDAVIEAQSERNGVKSIVLRSVVNEVLRGAP